MFRRAEEISLAIAPDGRGYCAFKGGESNFLALVEGECQDSPGLLAAEGRGC